MKQTTLAPLVLLLAILAFGQAPAVDKRNTDIPFTDTHFQARQYPTLEAWEQRKAELRQQILFAAGLDPMPEKTPLNAEVFGRIEHEDYTIEKVLLETMPGYYLGGNLYRPKGGAGNYPAVAKPHGHWAYGRLENQPLNSTPTLAANLARQGFVVLAYDMVGYNDTMQTPHRFSDPAQQLWGFGPLGLQLWNSIRVIDFLESLPDVDSDRIGMTGASGGGTQTFLAAAVDDRIKFSAPVNMVSAIMQGGCVCENAPGLRVDTFNVEFAAMMAPRPTLLISATGDWTKNLPQEEYPAVRSIYELYGAADKVEAVQIDAPHNYQKESREAVYRFFARHVQGRLDVGEVPEEGVDIEDLRNMLVFYARSLPTNALSFEGLFEQWKQMASEQTAATDDTDELQRRLRQALKTEWPAQVWPVVNGEKIVLTRPQEGQRIPGYWSPGDGVPALLIHPEGAARALESEAAARVREAGRPLLAIDVFQTGQAVAERGQLPEHFTTFNLSDDANRIQDILTALSFLQMNTPGEIELVGLEKGAVWSTFAAAVAPIEVQLTADLEWFDGSDEAFVENCFVPGILRAGGMEAARRLADPRP